MDVRSEEGELVLRTAAAWRKEGVVSYSVDQGCSIDSSRNNGNIDITITLKYKTSDLLKVFIDHGAETQLRYYYAANGLQLCTIISNCCNF